MSWGSLLLALKRQADGEVIFEFESGKVFTIEADRIGSLIGESKLLVDQGAVRRVLNLEKVEMVSWWPKKEAGNRREGAGSPPPPSITPGSSSIACSLPTEFEKEVGR